MNVKAETRDSQCQALLGSGGRGRPPTEGDKCVYLLSNGGDLSEALHLRLGEPWTSMELTCRPGQGHLPGREKDGQKEGAL